MIKKTKTEKSLWKWRNDFSLTDEDIKNIKKVLKNRRNLILKKGERC